MDNFYFLVTFLDEEERVLYSEEVKISVPSTDHPESDREEAGDRLDEWASEEMETNSAESYEYKLIDAC